MTAMVLTRLSTWLVGSCWNLFTFIIVRAARGGQGKDQRQHQSSPRDSPGAFRSGASSLLLLLWESGTVESTPPPIHGAALTDVDDEEVVRIGKEAHSSQHRLFHARQGQRRSGEWCEADRILKVAATSSPRSPSQPFRALLHINLTAWDEPVCGTHLGEALLLVLHPFPTPLHGQAELQGGRCDLRTDSLPLSRVIFAQ
jgi:hypothetical protein